jgi:hypothetical protein
MLNVRASGLLASAIPDSFSVALKDQTLHIRIAGVDAPEVC